MRLLLDTHTFIWFVTEDSQISKKARTLIEDINNELFLSVGTIWEMAIKIGLGKLDPPDESFETYMLQQLGTNSITLLNLTVAHTAKIIALPLHHRDPFDRLFIAQAIVEQMPIISKDSIFDAYNVTRLW